jgi:hypothetical protein
MGSEGQGDGSPVSFLQWGFNRLFARKERRERLNALIKSPVLRRGRGDNRTVPLSLGQNRFKLLRLPLVFVLFGKKSYERIFMKKRYEEIFIISKR